MSVQEYITEEALPLKFGFRTGDRGTMTSRTIMLSELSTVLNSALKFESKSERLAAIIDDNILGKRTFATRKLTGQRLSELYALDESVPIFRLLKEFWQLDQVARPLLALLCASARDPLLRITSEPVLRAKTGDIVSIEQFEAAVRYHTGNRFNPATINQIARNSSSSWQQSGHLTGRSVKIRSKPQVTPVTTAYALLLGYLNRARGAFLFHTFWSSLLDVPAHILVESTREAAARGWLNYRGIGSVIEIDFSPILTKEEEESLHE